MKKLNALALCAVLLPAYTLATTTVFAAEQVDQPPEAENAESQSKYGPETDGGTPNGQPVKQRANSANANATQASNQSPDEQAEVATQTGSQSAFHADDVIGQDIVNRADGTTIGSINGLVLSEEGQLLSVIAGVGGFLGIGNKNVAIPWSEVERSPAEDGDGYTLSVARDAQSLKDASPHDRASVGNSPNHSMDGSAN